MTENVRKCSAASRCGGCQYQGIPYPQQLIEKKKTVEKYCGNLAPVCEVQGMDQPYFYRNKVHAAFGLRRNGEILSGIYEENSHRIVPVEHCLIEDEKAGEVIRDIRDLLVSFRIPVYDEDTQQGLFRHVLIRTARATGQMLVVLVLASPVLPSKKNFIRAILERHPGITSIVINVNSRRTSMILGEREIPVYGKGYIEDILCGCRFRISAGSFYQVNPVQTERLYRKAIELAELKGREKVLDAYCGTGTIGILASRYAAEVTGAEINPSAVRDAEANAKANRCGNIRFVRADAGRLMERMAASGETLDVLLMDPPRTGSSREFLRAAAEVRPARIVYISCNPETLGRDVKLLTGSGYRPRGFWPFDMFPFCDDVETICLLECQKEAGKSGKATKNHKRKPVESRISQKKS